MAQRKNILVVAEAVAGKLHASVLELLSLARFLAGATGGEVGVALIEQGAASAVDALGEHGADIVCRALGADLAATMPEARLAPIGAACECVQPCVVLIAHSVLGAELGPRLAFRLGAAAATGCTEVTVDDSGVVRCTRPCYGGVAREVIVFDGTAVVATVRAGLYELTPIQAGRRAGRVVDLPPVDAAASRVKLVERNTESNEGPRLEDAKIIVAGGRGLEGPGGFDVLKELAAELGAAVGASRVPSDLGWCPHSMQIGLTGKTVTPDLYIAVGISGAGHHMAGCGNAKTIVAINSDPEAAIFQDARFGVVGDYREVVPALAARVRQMKHGQ